MNIQEFEHKYSGKTKKISDIVEKWVAEKEIDDFLGTSVMSGVLIGDLLTGDGLGDRIDPDVQEAFSSLMGDKANSFSEIREILIEKIQNGDDSVRGLLNKIQGQLGENTFVDNIGPSATLAESGSQMGWDVKIDHGDHTQFVQVKVYEDADKVIKKMKEVNERIENGELEGVSQIDFAVNSEIVDEVREKAGDLGFSNEVINMGASRDELRTLLENNFENIGDYSSLENFFGELFGGSIAASAIHAALNGFFLWKGAKDKDQAIDDTVYSSAVSAGGIAATLAVEKSLAIISAPLGGPIAIGVGIGARSVLSRVADRRFIVKRMESDNQRITDLGAKLNKISS